jgi:hypothetical protein
MPRIWFSFQRILGIRPGISFSLAELKGEPSHPRARVPLSSTPIPPANDDTPNWARVAAWEASRTRLIAI